MKLFYSIAAVAAQEMLFANDAPKVIVDLYYEAQCNGCRDAITHSFKKAMHTEGFLDMAEVNLYPYGNAHEKKKLFGGYTYKC